LSESNEYFFSLVDRVRLIGGLTLCRLNHSKVHYLARPEHPNNRTASQSQIEQSTRRCLWLLLELASRSAVPICHSPLRLHPFNHYILPCRLKWSKVLRFLFANSSSTQVEHCFSYECVAPALCTLPSCSRLELAHTWWHHTLLGLVTVKKTQVGVVQSEPK
jgi:hypothetical protein